MTVAAVKLDNRYTDYVANVGWRNRWWIVAASVIGLAVGQGSIMVFCFGIFLKPVSATLGLSRGTMSLGLLFAAAASALATPVVGLLIDRHGNRIVMLPGIAMFALAVAALSTLQSSPLALVYILLALAGLFGAVQTPIVYAALICKWFDRERGLALGLAMAGVGLGALIVPQLAALAIRTCGWRTAYLILSAMIFAFALVPVALFVREPSGLGRAERDHRDGRPSLPGLTIAHALTQSWRFWSLNAAFFIGGMSIQGTLAHVVAMLTDRGFGFQGAAAAFSSAGLAMIVGRVASGYSLDRFHGPSVAIGSFIAPAVGIALLASGLSGPVPLLGILLCGLGVGAQIGLQPFFASRYFGLKSIGAISGVMFGSFLAGLGLGPYLSGVCFDTWHSYVPDLVAYAIVLAAASILFVPLGPYPFASRPGR